MPWTAWAQDEGGNYIPDCAKQVANDDKEGDFAAGLCQTAFVGASNCHFRCRVRPKGQGLRLWAMTSAPSPCLLPCLQTASNSYLVWLMSLNVHMTPVANRLHATSATTSDRDDMDVLYSSAAFISHCGRDDIRHGHGTVNTGTVMQALYGGKIPFK
jgi:hypothetical protein